MASLTSAVVGSPGSVELQAHGPDRSTAWWQGRTQLQRQGSILMENWRVADADHLREPGRRVIVERVGQDSLDIVAWRVNLAVLGVHVLHMPADNRPGSVSC